MLINHILFWLMIAEGAICLVISLPFGQRISQAIIHFLNSRFGGKDSLASSVGTVIIAVIGLLFLSDINTCYRYHSEDAILSDGLRIRLVTAQRDMYISGFCLFLFLLLRLVYISMETNIRLDKSLAAMKKQAEGASTGYKNLLEENDKIKRQSEKLQALVAVDGDKDAASKVLSKLLDENLELTKKMETVTKELKSAEGRVEAVKKQAESQSTAFMKLMDEKSAVDKQAEAAKTLEAKVKQQADEIATLKADRDSLKSQIQDYDFMFTEAKKKAE